MRQVTDRIRPWAPTMLGVGLFASLAESLQERDLTSIAMLLVALLGFFLVVRQHRGLTRGEVRAEIHAGVRALVRDDALIKTAPVLDHVQKVKLMRGRRIEEVPMPGSTLADAPTDPGQSQDPYWH